MCATVLHFRVCAGIYFGYARVCVIVRYYNNNKYKVLMTREARRPISRTKGKKKRRDKQNHRIFNKIVHREFCLSLKAVYMNFAKVCSFFVSLDCQILFHLSSAGNDFTSALFKPNSNTKS